MTMDAVAGHVLVTPMLNRIIEQANTSVSVKGVRRLDRSWLMRVVVVVTAVLALAVMHGLDAGAHHIGDGMPQGPGEATGMTSPHAAQPAGAHHSDSESRDAHLLTMMCLAVLVVIGVVVARRRPVGCPAAGECRWWVPGGGPVWPVQLRPPQPPWVRLCVQLC
jgi:hypothetical protein